MVMKKFLGAALLTCPWALFANLGHQQQQQQQVYADAGMSIEALQAECRDYHANPQIKPFRKEILCSGNYSWWETEAKPFALAQRARATTHLTTKDGRFQTKPGSFAHALSAHGSRCQDYSKKEMATRVPLKMTIDDCDQINAEFIYATCKGLIEDSCEGNYVLAEELDLGSSQGQAQQQQQQQQRAPEGVCILSTVDHIDTCSAYRE